MLLGEHTAVFKDATLAKDVSLFCTILGSLLCRMLLRREYLRPVVILRITEAFD